MHNKRNIIVTGASSGIGAATVKKLLDEGHQIIGIARRFEKLLSSEANFHPVCFDLSQIDELPAFLEQMKDQYPQVDALICNAGRGHFGELEQLSYMQMRSLIELNFLSHAFLAKAYLPLLKQKEYGDIIFIGSEAGLSGKRKGSMYCASKFALRGFSQALREECAKSNVRVSIIQPGMVRTAFYDLLDFSPGEAESHALHPGDIAEAVSLILRLRKEAVCDEIILTPLKKVIRKRKSST